NSGWSRAEVDAFGVGGMALSCDIAKLGIHSVLYPLSWRTSMSAKERDDPGEDGFADSGGVKIHYVTKGVGPLVVLVHGIPGFWYDWRHQLPALAEHFQVVAIDQRGFNLSDQPDGVENYTLDKLVGDVDAVVQHFGQPKATLVGHDSGGW